MTILILIISFILDGIMSLLIAPNSILFPLFTLMSIIIVYKFKPSNLLYLVICAITGLIYGITYDNLFLDTGLFLLIGIFIIIIYQKIEINTLSIIILSIAIIILYRTLTYLISLFITRKLSIYFLLRGIYSSFIVNTLYVIVINFLVNKLNKKYNWF